MTTTSSVSSTTSTSTTSSSSSSTSSSEQATIDYNDFLKLLIAELKYQDPTDPMDSTEYVTQLASFSSVEQQIKTNSKLDELLSSSALSEAESVIGRTVTSADGQTSGVVTSVKLDSEGSVATLDNGKTLKLGSGISVS